MSRHRPAKKWRGIVKMGVAIYAFSKKEREGGQPRKPDASPPMAPPRLSAIGVTYPSDFSCQQAKKLSGQGREGWSCLDARIGSK
jgi:hypothetical protein